MMMVFAAMAQLECDMIMIRQVEGIQIAKAEGTYKGRKRIKLDEKLFFQYFIWKEGKTYPQYICQKFGISHSTLSDGYGRL